MFVQKKLYIPLETAAMLSKILSVESGSFGISAGAWVLLLLPRRKLYGVTKVLETVPFYLNFVHKGSEFRYD